MSINKTKILFLILLTLYSAVRGEFQIPNSGFQESGLLKHPLRRDLKHPTLIIGYQNLFTGFPETINHQDLAFIYPWKDYLFHLSYQQDNHEWLNEGNFVLNAGKRTNHYEAALGFSYRFSKFNYPENQGDMSDPVLKDDGISALSFQIHQRAYYKQMSLNLSLFHLNQPDYSFDGRYQLPFSYQVNVSYSFQFSVFSSCASIGHMKDYGIYGSLENKIAHGLFDLDFLAAADFFQFKAGLNRIKRTPIGVYYYYKHPLNELKEVSVYDHGFFLKYSFFKPPAPAAKPEPIVKKEAPAQYTITLFPKDSIKIHSILKMEEINPVIPYVFFHPGTDKMFDPKASYSAQHPFFINYNHSVLKTVAGIMNKDDEQRLILTGVNDPSLKKTQTAYHRAEAVKRALVEEYSVNENQISVNNRLAPPLNSERENPELIKENSAVHLEVVNKNIFSVKLKYQYLKKLKTPLNIQFNTDRESLAAKFTLKSPYQVIDSFFLSSYSPNYRLTPKEEEVILRSDKLNVGAIIYDNNKPINRYSKDLIFNRDSSVITEAKRIRVFLFDFNEASRNQKDFSSKLEYLLREIKRISPRFIHVIGYTDDIGEEGYNHQLGRKRAEFIKARMIENGINKNLIKVISKGENSPLADSRLPWGRILNRRVEIVFYEE